MIIRNRIREVREHAGKTARELADLMGVDPGRISRVEHEQVAPQEKTLKRIAGALGVSIHDLVP